MKMSETTTLLESIRVFRNEGDYDDAFSLLNRHLKTNQKDLEVLIEAVRMSIALGANEQALKLFHHLQMLPDWQQSLPGGIRLRLTLLFPDKFDSQFADAAMEDSASWCTAYKKNDKIPLYAANLLDWLIKCGDGTTTYIFESQCQCCREKHRVPVHMSLFIYREYLCPQCLASQYIDYELIKEHITRQDSKPTSTEMHRCDDYLRSLRNRLNFDTLEKNEFPSLCQYLNIDYAFILNQIVLRRLYEE